MKTCKMIEWLRVNVPGVKAAWYLAVATIFVLQVSGEIPGFIKQSNFNGFTVMSGAQLGCSDYQHYTFDRENVVVQCGAKCLARDNCLSFRHTTNKECTICLNTGRFNVDLSRSVGTERTKYIIEQAWKMPEIQFGTCGHAYTFRLDTNNMAVICANKTNWNDARASCQDMGGDLVTLENLQKQEAFEKVLEEFYKMYTDFHGLRTYRDTDVTSGSVAHAYSGVSHSNCLSNYIVLSGITVLTYNRDNSDCNLYTDPETTLTYDTTSTTTDTYKVYRGGGSLDYQVTGVNNKIWIGGHDPSSTGYTWLNGESMGVNHVDEYEQWIVSVLPGKCARTFHAGLWSASTCTSENMYACSIPVSTGTIQHDEL